MTNQEVFNAVWHHIIKQGKASISLDRKHCLYRGPENTKCAAGVLISDEVYNNRMECTSVLVVQQQFGVFKGINISLLEDLQQCHDRAALRSGFLASFKERARLVALTWYLTVPHEEDSHEK